MTKVFVDVGLSLDGYIAGPHAGPGNPLGDRGTHIHEWVFGLASFRERLGMAGGETNSDDTIVREVFARAGAYVMGKRMFEEGEVSWPENPPFRAPVYVLTHHRRDPWVRAGGTTFYFVSDGIESALDRARQAAGRLDVRISGGADTIRQYVGAGLVDEMAIHLAPLLLGSGRRLFDGAIESPRTIEPVAAVQSRHVTHLTYRFA